MGRLLVSILSYIVAKTPDRAIAFINAIISKLKMQLSSAETPAWLRVDKEKALEELRSVLKKAQGFFSRGEREKGVAVVVNSIDESKFKLDFQTISTVAISFLTIKEFYELAVGFFLVDDETKEVSIDPNKVQDQIKIRDESIAYKELNEALVTSPDYMAALIQKDLMDSIQQIADDPTLYDENHYRLLLSKLEYINSIIEGEQDPELIFKKGRDQRVSSDLSRQQFTDHYRALESDAIAHIAHAEPQGCFTSVMEALEYQKARCALVKRFEFLTGLSANQAKELYDLLKILKEDDFELRNL